MSEGSDAHGTQVTVIAVIEADNCDLIGNFAAYAQEVADESVSDFIVIADHRGTVAEVKLTEVFQYISVSIVQQIAPFLCGVPSRHAHQGKGVLHLVWQRENPGSAGAPGCHRF